MRKFGLIAIAALCALLVTAADHPTDRWVDEPMRTKTAFSWWYVDSALTDSFIVTGPDTTFYDTIITVYWHPRIVDSTWADTTIDSSYIDTLGMTLDSAVWRSGAHILDSFYTVDSADTFAFSYITPADSTLDAYYEASTSTHTAAVGVDTFYMAKADPDTSMSILIGPWRRAAAVVTVKHANDSVDGSIYFDVSWDGITWTCKDTTAITDTTVYPNELDSSAVYIHGIYLRARVDPTAGVQQKDTLATSLLKRPAVFIKLIHGSDGSN